MLGFLTVLTFCNCLLNGFVGDDGFLIVHNTFFQKWENVRLLFDPSVMTQSDNVFNSSQYFHTGSVAFRPVLSLSYFLDFALFQKNAWGYHLHSLLIHVLNVVGVYTLLRFLSDKKFLALSVALLFSLHPLKSDPVCSIGYRADLLACLWMLGAFLSYAAGKGRGDGKKRRALGAVSYLCYALALLSKESTIIFPVLLISYDVVVKREKVFSVPEFLGRYGGYLFLLFLYLFAYVFFMKNHTLQSMAYWGGNIFSHMGMMLQIFFHYALSFIWPLHVKVLPPGYLPAWSGFSLWVIACGCVFLVLLAVVYKKALKTDRLKSFFIIWFFVCLLPVANVVPIANPMANRFLYLPSIGIAYLLAVWMLAFMAYLKTRFSKASYDKMFYVGIIGVCSLMTMTLNTAWKSDSVLALHMMKDYPHAPQGYLLLALQVFDEGLLHEAKDLADKSLELGISDPRAYYIAGATRLTFLDKSKPYFERCIQEFPQYALAYVALGRIYFFKEDDNKALHYFQKSIQLSSSYAAYAYMMQIYIKDGNISEAQRLFHEARQHIQKKEYLLSLENILKIAGDWRGPVDVGI